ncbi:MAG: hypothetical protein QOG96_2856 [Pseudonocardiales bacterium]|nr:hypothetical protein [Pseudonocardiales bacterium]
MIRKLGRGALTASVMVVLTVGGSAAMAGTAFAGCDHDGSHDSGSGSDGSTDNVGGNGGNGGAANANCGVPIGISAGVVGQGGDNSQCNATGGDGADGGTGANY